MTKNDLLRAPNEIRIVAQLSYTGDHTGIKYSIGTRINMLSKSITNMISYDPINGLHEPLYCDALLHSVDVDDTTHASISFAIPPYVDIRWLEDAVAEEVQKPDYSFDSFSIQVARRHEWAVEFPI